MANDVKHSSPESLGVHISMPYGFKNILNSPNVGKWHCKLKGGTGLEVSSDHLWVSWEMRGRGRSERKNKEFKGWN